MTKAKKGTLSVLAVKLERDAQWWNEMGHPRYEAAIRSCIKVERDGRVYGKTRRREICKALDEMRLFCCDICFDPSGFTIGSDWLEMVERYTEVGLGLSSGL